MSLADDIRSHFFGFEFGAPCSETEIQQAEAALCERIPAILRELYGSFNGFRGPTNAAFFWPLFSPKPDYSSLVATNRFFRQGDPFPQELIKECLFFGDSGIGFQWGLKKDLPGKIIRWDARWGMEFEIAGNTPLDAWLEEKKNYDELTEQK
jgi:hypothetical protein